MGRSQVVRVGAVLGLCAYARAALLAAQPASAATVPTAAPATPTGSQSPGLGVLIGAFAVGLLGLGVLIGTFFAAEQTGRLVRRRTGAIRRRLARAAPRRRDGTPPVRAADGASSRSAAQAVTAATLAEEVARATRDRLAAADRAIASSAARATSAERAAALARERAEALEAERREALAAAERAQAAAAAAMRRATGVEAGPGRGPDTVVPRPPGKAARRAEAARRAQAARRAEAAGRAEAARRAQAEAARRAEAARLAAAGQRAEAARRAAQARRAADARREELARQQAPSPEPTPPATLALPAVAEERSAELALRPAQMPAARAPEPPVQVPSRVWSVDRRGSTVPVQAGGAPARVVNGTAALARPRPASVVTVPLPEPLRVPMSARMAWGAEQVRATVHEQRCAATVAATTTRLSRMRNRVLFPERQTAKEAKVARWCLLAQVPGVVVLRFLIDPGWLFAAFGSPAGVVGVVVLVVEAALGSFWVWTATRPPFSLRLWSRPEPEPHDLRSVLVTEQMALRLAAHEPPGEAWRQVSAAWGLPADSEAGALVSPAQAVDRAAELWAEMSRGRVAEEGTIARVTVVPYFLCIMPAFAIALLV